MFKGTFKDIVTNILGLLTLISAVVKIIIDYSATVDLSTMPWYQYILGLAIAIAMYFIGKGGDGKAKPA
jgi:hypothetical protein